MNGRIFRTMHGCYHAGCLSALAHAINRVLLRDGFEQKISHKYIFEAAIWLFGSKLKNDVCDIK